MPSVIQTDVLRTGFPGVVLPATTWVSVDAGYDLTRFRSKLLSVKNVGANVISDGAVQGTTVPPAKRVDTDWLDVDPTVFANLAAGATKTWQVPDAGNPLSLLSTPPAQCERVRGGRERRRDLKSRPSSWRRGARQS
jgi:hypothetical protein